MTSRDFCYWLQGYIELQSAAALPAFTEQQTHKIKAHLAMVFKHDIDPSMGDKKHQDDLSLLHRGLFDSKVNC